MFFQAILYICLVATHPSQCNVETAVAVSQGPKVKNDLMCGKSGQAMSASTEWRQPREGLEYLKISCVRGDDRV